MAGPTAQYVHPPKERNAENLTIFQNYRKFLKINRYIINR
jgi:hypothetical protein